MARHIYKTPMELREYIKQTLVSIVEGIDDANAVRDRFRLNHNKHENGESGQTVEFDVSIIVIESSKDEVGGGVGGSLLNVVSAGVNSKIDHNNSQQDIQRLKFKVFITEQ
jgi:hypothetical protein